MVMLNYHDYGESLLVHLNHSYCFVYGETSAQHLLGLMLLETIYS